MVLLTIFAIVSFIIAFIFLIVSIFQFCEKGFLFNNAYIWADKKEREKLNKKPHYRQSGIAFTLCAAIFLAMGLGYLFLMNWLWIIVGALLVVLLVFAILTSVKEIK